MGLLGKLIPWIGAHALEVAFERTLGDHLRLKSRVSRAEEQLRCSSTGHAWGLHEATTERFYANTVTDGPRDDLIIPRESALYRFKCSRCGLTYTKTNPHITPAERQLIDLGVVLHDQPS